MPVRSRWVGMPMAPARTAAEGRREPSVPARSRTASKEGVRAVGGRFGGQQCSRAHGRLLGDQPCITTSAASRRCITTSAASSRRPSAAVPGRRHWHPDPSAANRHHRRLATGEPNTMVDDTDYWTLGISILPANLPPADLLCRSRITISAWCKGRCGHRLRPGRSGQTSGRNCRHPAGPPGTK